MQLLTAREYAIQTGKAERTVRGWVEGLSEEEQQRMGVFRVGRAWAATAEAWEALGQSKGTQGRRDSAPRRKIVPPTAP